MQCVLAAETAVLFHFKSVRIVLLVFLCVIISLLAFSAGECNFDSHYFRHLLIEFGSSPLNTSLNVGSVRLSQKSAQKKPPNRGTVIISCIYSFVNTFLLFYKNIFYIIIVRIY